MRANWKREGSERIIPVPGSGACTGLSHVQNIVSFVAPLGAGVSKVSIDSVSNLH